MYFFWSEVLTDFTAKDSCTFDLHCSYFILQSYTHVFQKHLQFST